MIDANAPVVYLTIGALASVTASELVAGTQTAI